MSAHDSVAPQESNLPGTSTTGSQEEPTAESQTTHDPTMIDVILTDTTGTSEWDVTIPIDKGAAALIARFLKSEDLPFRRTDSEGNPIPYRLRWVEGGRILLDSETLMGAGVRRGHTLALQHEARAGLGALLVIRFGRLRVTVRYNGGAEHD